MSENDDLYGLAEEVGIALEVTGFVLTTAESCTGGWVSQCITDVPGSSEWFDRGFVTYSNESKTEMLGVSPETLATYGAVSEATVRAMAEGALKHSRADIAVAISGIAGPDGGSWEKPVGTVWFAWQRVGQPCRTHRECFSGDRREIRRQAVEAVLWGILDVCHRS